MADELESIRDMFDEASIDDKSRFLFNAILGLREETRKGFETVNTSFESMRKACECRQNNCSQNFVTKKQARVFGVIMAAFAAGIGIGTGVITWTELAKRAIP